MGQLVYVEPERIALSFSIDGLSAREELLFKSFVRILSHRTHHTWLYSPIHDGREASLTADLTVLAEDRHLSAQRPENTAAKPFLVLGHINYGKQGYLCLPLNPNELELELNRQGDLILKNRSSPALQTPNGSGLAVGIKSSNWTGQLRLLRWPPPNLLGSTIRIRLATLMTGQPLTLIALQKRSGLPEQVCIDFVTDLNRLGLLSQHFPDAQQQAAVRPNPPVIQTGLLARIRSRLGLQAGKRN